MCDQTGVHWVSQWTSGDRLHRTRCWLAGRAAGPCLLERGAGRKVLGDRPCLHKGREHSGRRQQRRHTLAHVHPGAAPKRTRGVGSASRSPGVRPGVLSSGLALLCPTLLRQHISGEGRLIPDPGPALPPLPAWDFQGRSPAFPGGGTPDRLLSRRTAMESNPSDDLFPDLKKRPCIPVCEIPALVRMKIKRKKHCINYRNAFRTKIRKRF